MTMPGIVTLGTVVAATVAASGTDWLFFDLFVHRYYIAEPSIWRPGGKIRIVLSQVIGTLATCSAVAASVFAPGHAVSLAVLLWSAGALPIGIQNLFWLRMHPAIAASHAVGWFVRLLIGTMLTQWLLS
jgi:hypothetical protein